MKNPPAVFEKIFRLRSYEVDCYGKASALVLVNFLQDMAGEHAQLLDFSVAELQTRGLTWVLHRIHYRFLHYPQAGESITCTTWLSGRERLAALRDFELRDGSGQLVGVASSSWLLVNLRSMRPVRLDKHLPDYPCTARRAMAADFNALSVAETLSVEKSFQACLSDLDLNQHVNNANYLRWAIDSLPEDFLRRNQLFEIEINYQAAAFCGDQILARAGIVENEPGPAVLHQLLREKDGSELVLLKTLWRKMDDMERLDFKGDLR